MAFNKTQLRNDLIEIFNNPSTEGNVNAVATALAEAIDNYVKTGNAIGTDTNGDTHNLTLQ